MRQTVYRWHEFYSGLVMEQGKSTKDDKGKTQEGQTPLRLNTDAYVDGGSNRSSKEDSVMELERRVGIIQLELPLTTSVKGRRTKGVTAKGIPVTRSMVWQAYKKVRKNKGSGGVDGKSLKTYSEALEDNLYKLWNRLTSGSYFTKAVKQVSIPKKDGSQRKLGIPTIDDRIEVLASIKTRVAACQLRLHEGKTKIVFCKKFKRSTSKTVKFDFLGFSFQPRPSATKDGRMFLGYDCAISQSSKNKIISEIKSTKFQRWTNRRIEEIAEFFNTKIQGWINYYGKFRKYKLNSLFRIFEGRLIEWARRRYKHLGKSYIKASKWFYRFKKNNVRLFVHWERGFINA